MYVSPIAFEFQNIYSNLSMNLSVFPLLLMMLLLFCFFFWLLLNFCFFRSHCFVFVCATSCETGKLSISSRDYKLRMWSGKYISEDFNSITHHSFEHIHHGQVPKITKISNWKLLKRDRRQNVIKELFLVFFLNFAIICPCIQCKLYVES